MNWGKSDWSHLRLSALAVLMLTGCFAGTSMAQSRVPKTFASPIQASTALFTAIQSNDVRAILAVLGSDGKKIVSSGDETEDAHERANIVQRYQEMHRLVREPDGTVTLYLGARNWPLPIPIVGAGTSWHFDTAAGQKEILYRRVGRNEIATIRICQALVAAEAEYYVAQHHYTAKIFSDAGQHNGLYWQAVSSEPKSPIGPMLASAMTEVPRPSGTATPYHGYYYHILTSQGKSAEGGAKVYLIEGQIINGFAFVAYPAEYRSSGVMTFIVGHDGVVFEKDLGKNSTALARAMKEFDPDRTWSKSEDAQEQAAATAGDSNQH
jgi:hypothetical protein